jgi:hypothetical protein
MIATASKLWLAVTALAFGATAIYLVASEGEWFGSMVLGSLVLAAAVLAGLSIATHDGDAPPVLGHKAEVVTVVSRRSLPAPWPVLGAVSVGTVLIGLAGNSLFFYAGIAFAVLILGEWLVQGWAERVTGDDIANQELRNRLMFPLEVPVTAALGVGFVVITFSRVLLALPKTGSTVIAIVVASAILGISSLIAAKPRLSSSLVTAVVALGAVTFLVAGVVGAVSGHRTFHEHHSGESAQETSEK